MLGFVVLVLNTLKVNHFSKILYLLVQKLVGNFNPPMRNLFLRETPRKTMLCYIYNSQQHHHSTVKCVGLLRIVPYYLKIMIHHKCPIKGLFQCFYFIRLMVNVFRFNHRVVNIDFHIVNLQK